MMLLEPESKINSISSSVKTVSLSSKTSFRSIETTSPVSSSTKSSTQVLKTLAASLRPAAFFKAFLVAATSSERPNRSRISLSEPYPIALSKVVTGNFFLRSIYAYMTLLMSVANSIQDPLKGMILAE